MHVKDCVIKLGVPANLSELFSHSSFIDPDLHRDKLSKADLEKCTALQQFLKKHSHSSHYAFQLKKCRDPTCFYCCEHPIRLCDDVFDKLSFLPLPLLN